MKFLALCHTCAHKHTIEFDPKLGPNAAFSDWLTKHPGSVHDIDFVWPERTGKAVQPRDDRRWEHYVHNADVKVAYAATATPTMTLASLAASSTLLAGRESSSISNASNKYLDSLCAGNYRAAASNNQAGNIYTCVVGPRDDTPTWPDVFDGTDSTETVTDAGTFNSICRIISSIAADNTASQTWYWGPVTIAGFFGGVLPTAWVFFVTQNIQTSTNAWSATEGDHAVRYTSVYATVS